MLTTLIEAQRPQLTALAQTWLSFGATSFSLWVDETPLASWPTNSRAAKPSAVADVVVSLNTIGELRLTGVNSSAVQQRLEADAQLISSRNNE